MAVHALSDHFRSFFGRLNPGTSFEQRASSEHQSIVRLIEDPSGLASALAPRCILQGSYKQQTAIHSINDVDIIALCRIRPSFGLWLEEKQRWRRDELFKTIAAPLCADPRYQGKIRYGNSSMCIKVNLGIRVEILPVIYHSMLADYEADYDKEPFLLYRPETGRWEDGYARTHQRKLSEKNQTSRTGGNFIPAVKVFKHLRSIHKLEVVSFHLECLLYSLPNRLFQGNPATYIAAVLHEIAATSAQGWYNRTLRTPCGERDVFRKNEWNWDNWKRFHDHMIFFDRLAQAAQCAPDRQLAIQTWQHLLGNNFFPTQV